MYTKEQLEKFSVYDLRKIARNIGVKSPTILKKRQIIDEIMQIQSGLKQPNIPSKRGRTVMKGEDNLINCEKESANKKELIINALLKEVRIKLEKILKDIL